MLNRVSGASRHSRIARDAAGHFKTRAAFTFVFGGAIFLALHSIATEPASAQFLPSARSANASAASAPVTGSVFTAPDQHRAPVTRPLPAPQPIHPVQIDPNQRQQLVEHQTDAMKREHCLRKLEARRRALLEQQRAARTDGPK